MLAPPPESAARRYRIEKYLTEGGMGAIYIGKKLGPGGFAKEVVLKQLLPEYTSRPEFRDLFFREAKISATLDHANIVHTFDLVESDQSLFIVMEYVRGADLRTIIRRARHRKRELSPAAAIHVALEILAGLAYAHARRDATGKSLDIIHRDVSPSNIICSVQGAAKLSDFGIAKASTYSSVFYRVRGKVGYMSPEQARNQQIDHRCDLFSLSVCLYESLSGERLYVGDLNTPADEIYGIKPLPVSHKRPGLPVALDEVMARALAPHVDDRYQSAAELADALRTVAYRAGLAFSAPELAAHLQDILGPDPERWLRDEPSPVAMDAAAKPGAGNEKASPEKAGEAAELVGKEAASLGIVDDMPEDEPGRSMLSPKAVSGSKDFDLESMLNDEATRPGGEERSTHRTPVPTGDSPAGTLNHQSPDGRVRTAETPPPVWTRDSGPFALATPKPVSAAGRQGAKPLASAGSVPPPVAARAAAPPAAPLASPAPPSPPPPSRARASRPLPRATMRGTAAPPPVPPTGRSVPPPPPPRLPAGSTGRSGGDFSGEIEEATPGFARPTAAASYRSGFEIEDALTPPPPQAPRMSAVPDGVVRSPPAPYPVVPVGIVESSVPELPLPSLQAPQTMDFQDAVNGLLPERRGGPPGWLAAMLVLVSLVSGAALAHRFTRSQVALALAAAPSMAKVRPATTSTAEASAPASDSPTRADRAVKGTERMARDDLDGAEVLDAPPNVVAGGPAPVAKAPSGSAEAAKTKASRAVSRAVKGKQHRTKAVAKRRVKH